VFDDEHQGHVRRETLREDFVFSWATWITGTIKDTVQEYFSYEELRRWPLLQSWDASAYELPEQHMVFVLRDRLLVMPVTSDPVQFPYSDHPTLPPKIEEIERWQSYLKEKFDLREEDAAFVMPIRDSGEFDARADFELFSEDEKMFWAEQMAYIIRRQAAHLLDQNGGRADRRLHVSEAEWVPPAIRESLREFKDEHPYPARVAFILMQFGRTKAHKRITKAVKDGLAAHGIIGVRADDKEYHADLFPNVQTYMHGCGLGVAVFERIEAERFNPNVALEVGYMLAMDKPVCLLKDETLTTLPADLVGKLYREFDPQEPTDTIPKNLSRWLTDRGLSQS
jgi:hypothetical protein